MQLCSTEASDDVTCSEVTRDNSTYKHGRSMWQSWQSTKSFPRQAVCGQSLNSTKFGQDSLFTLQLEVHVEITQEEGVSVSGKSWPASTVSSSSIWQS